MATKIKGDIFETNGLYIIHQYNCTTDRAKHLAWTIFQKYPFANVYKQLEGIRSTPGTIEVSKAMDEPEKYKHQIIAFFAQYYPGMSRWRNDTFEMREKWFQSCLDKLAELPDLDQGVCFPWGIGCGAAGGDWKKYKKMINAFANNNEKAKVFIYHNVGQNKRKFF